MLVGSEEECIQLVPKVVLTTVGANTGTLKLSIVVCKEQVLVDSTIISNVWKHQVEAHKHSSMETQHSYINSVVTLHKLGLLVVLFCRNHNTTMHIFRNALCNIQILTL